MLVMQQNKGSRSWPATVTFQHENEGRRGKLQNNSPKKDERSHTGGILTFELKAGLEGGRKFRNGLKWLSMTNNLGDSRTIASHPASTTHSKLSEAERQAVGITPGLIRLSVGLEHPEDVIEEILQALHQ